MIAMVPVVRAFLLTITVCLSVHADTYDVKDGRHNITLGHRRVYPNYPTDILLFHDTPKAEGTLFPYPRVESHNVCYPPKGSHPGRLTITAFNVTDLVPGGQGGYAFIKRGGVGADNLCLHLKTQRGNGYLFSVHVWGYYY